MYRCRHEQGENPYASGNENRRRNRDRLNGDIERYNFLRRINSEGYGLPFGGPCDMPGCFAERPRRPPPGFPPIGLGGLGLGIRGALNHLFGPRGGLRPPGYPGIYGPRCYPPPDDDDDSDSDDDESPPPWYPPSPPWYGISSLLTPRLPPRPSSGRRLGFPAFRRSRRVYYGDYDDYDDDYGYMPRHRYPRRGLY